MLSPLGGAAEKPLLLPALENILDLNPSLKLN